MRELCLAALIVVVAAQVDAQPLSAQGKAAFDLWHLEINCNSAHGCIPTPGVPPGAFALFGSRRFASNALTWRVLAGSEELQAPAAALMANVQAWMTPVVSLKQVPASDETANYYFHLGTSFTTQHGRTIQVAGCAQNPFFVDRAHPTMVKIEIVCASGAEASRY